MDSITQAALGAAVGEMMLGRRLGNRALAWGALFGTLPDLDVVLAPFLDHAANLWWHRGPSHSLLVMVLASWGLSQWLAKRWKRDKITRARAGCFVFAVWSTHVLIDCFTVYGTAVLWPFSDHRAGFNHLFIIDFFFTMPMLVALVWLAFLRTKKQVPQRRRLNAWGLGIAAAYALLSVGMKQVASAGFDADLARRGVTYERRMEAPTPFNIMLWRSVVDRGDELWVGYRTVFERHKTPVRWTIYPRGAEALAGMEDLREVRRLKWFSDGWWIARRHAKGAWVGDLRFGESRNWGDKKGMVDSRLSFSWNVLPQEKNERLQPLRPTRTGVGETLRRMVLRTVGQRVEWEANPRLAGVTGSLPEFLAVEE
ncbi:MAG: metal-dependent hydrolase [Luteolibacter sp.]|nr:metal-dependent hydrolase [Luteolibacter sp.]